MRYRRKPEKVEAFQFGADCEITAPDWFAVAVQKEQVSIDRAITDGAVRIYGCTIMTDTGKMKAKNGDYIVRAADGSIFPVKRQKFKKQYEKE